LHDATEETQFSTAGVDNSLLGRRQQANRLPGDDDVVQDAATREVLQVVFSANLLGALGGYISRLTNAEKIGVRVSVSQRVQ
jgi:hypothetical protein